MKIDEFCAQFGEHQRSIDAVLRDWQLAELADSLDTLQSRCDGAVDSTAVIVGDALHGDGMLDQIPPELRDAVAGLMGEKSVAYDEVRQFLHERCANLDHGSLAGFTNYVKGRIGENLFCEHVGHGAKLADSVIQEGWDASIAHPDGWQYIQIKLYSDPHGIVRHMHRVHEKVLAGSIKGVDHITPVDHIYFAVPADIHDDVREIIADRHPELLSMLYDKSIPIDAQSAADIVSEGIGNVGPDQLSHFFHELLGGAIAAGSLHAIVNGFLWYKGAKEFSGAVADAAASTAISTSGIAVGLAAELLCHSAALSGAIGIGGRLFLQRMARSRWNFAEFLEHSNARAEATITALASPLPALA